MPGGVAILFRSNLAEHIKVLELGLDWCVGIQISFGEKRACILCIYLPHQCPSNEEQYIEKLGILTSVVEELETSCFAIVGDWNADLRNPDRSLFASHMLDFCEESDLLISSCSFLPRDSYSYVSSAWQTVSWLDHVVSSFDFHSVVTDMSILYSMSADDHIPVKTTLSIGNMPNFNPPVQIRYDKVNWEKLTNDECRQYGSLTDRLLKNVCEPMALQCRDINCSDPAHCLEICNFYNSIIHSLKAAGEQIASSHPRCSGQARPGWNEHVADLYSDSRRALQLWIDAGKPHDGYIADLHRRTRARCKYAIRFIKKHESTFHNTYKYNPSTVFFTYRIYKLT